MNKSKRDEKWIKIKGIDDYYISSTGTINKLVNGVYKKRKPSIGSNGYYQLVIRKKCYRVHRLVALSFNLINESDWVNHIDGNKLNNNLLNLEKSNPSHNMAHSYRIGLKKPVTGDKNNFAKITDKDAIEIIKRYASGENTKYIAQDFKISISSISAIGHGRNRKYLKKYRDLYGAKKRR